MPKNGEVPTVGEYSVGHRQLTLVDEERGERSLVVDMWYPGLLKPDSHDRDIDYGNREAFYNAGVLRADLHQATTPHLAHQMSRFFRNRRDTAAQGVPRPADRSGNTSNPAEP